MELERIVIRSNQEECIEGLTIEYPYVLHQADLSRISIPWHWHEAVEFDYVISGEVEVTTTSGKYIFGKNEAFFVNTNVLCCMKGTEESVPAVMHSHLFHPIFLSGHYKSVFETKYINPVLQDKKLDILEIRGGSGVQKLMLKKLQQAFNLQKEENSEFSMRNLFSEIWMLLLEEVENRPKENRIVNLRDQDRIQTMLAYIHQNYMEKISLDDIAEAAFISSRECIRCFRNIIGQSPIEHLIDYRLEVAAELLRDTDTPVTDIGLQTGFSSNAYFGKAFKEKYGTSPAKYRKTVRELLSDS